MPPRERSMRPSCAARRKVSHSNGMAITKVTANPTLRPTIRLSPTPMAMPIGKSRDSRASARHIFVPRHGWTRNPITPSPERSL